MTDEALFLKVDCLALQVPDLDPAIAFYAGLGHEVLWRTTSSAGLRLPESEAEFVVQTERPGPETDLTVVEVSAALERFVAAVDASSSSHSTSRSVDARLSQTPGTTAW